MTCPECGYPKLPIRTEKCWRANLTEPCRRRMLNPDVDILEEARPILTDPQFEVFELELQGHGTMTIARRLLLTRSAVRDRLHNAHTRLLKEGLRMDANGNWYREGAA